MDVVATTAATNDSRIVQQDGCVDWTGCDLVERVPGKVSGRPIVRGTRILSDTIVQDFELGCSLEEIQENYPDLPLAIIQRLIAFAQARAERHFA